MPVVVKLSGSFLHLAREWALGVKEAGADGIACSDAFGPALKIDIRTGEPALGGPRGVGGLTGPAIMPLTLRMVLEIASTVDLPIIGVGGVETAADVVEYLMAGATLVGVCTAGHLKGPARYTRLLRDLEALLAELGVSRPQRCAASRCAASASGRRRASSRSPGRWCRPSTKRNAPRAADARKPARTGPCACASGRAAGGKRRGPRPSCASGAGCASASAPSGRSRRSITGIPGFVEALREPRKRRIG